MPTPYKYDGTKYMEANDRLTEMTELDRCLEKSSERGFTDQFRAITDGLKSIDTEKVYQPADIKIENFFRFEGISNPDDMSILYEIETNDGQKGTLIDAYGLYSDPKVASFMVDVDDIQKKVVKRDHTSQP